MTGEEAINFGEMFLEVNKDSKNSSTYEFVEMAIKVLKQKSMLDKIKAEIEQIYQEIDTASHNEYENAVEEGKEKAYENVLDMIDKYTAEK